MAMQSGLVYGRLIIGQAKQILFRRAVTEASKQSFRLVTAFCGFAKYSNNHYPKRKFLYGEDAFFIAENKFSNVLGRAFLLKFLLDFVVWFEKGLVLRVAPRTTASTFII